MKTAKSVKGPYPYKGSGTRCLWHTSDGKYIVTSSVDNMIGSYRVSETMAFPADADGAITDYGELARTGYNRHAECITAAGYRITQ